MKIKYDIRYEHLEDEIATGIISVERFNLIRDLANSYKLELSDEDFKNFFEMSEKVDINWLMFNMSTHKNTLIKALIAYMSY